MVWANLKESIERQGNERIALLDQKLSIAAVSPQLCKLLASGEDRLVGRPLESAFSFSDPSVLEAMSRGECPNNEIQAVARLPHGPRVELTLRVGDTKAAPQRGFVLKVVRYEIVRRFFEEDVDYEVEIRDGHVGQLLRLSFLGGAACEKDLAGRKCFEVVCGRATTCDVCPALQAGRQALGEEHSMVRQHGNVLELSTARLVGPHRVQVRTRHLSAAHLRNVREARIHQLAREAELSRREQEVLDHILLGAPTGEIAQRLGIAVRTVKFHQANLLEKLGADSRVDLLRVLA